MLILMDTALSLMMVKEPVYPLDIVRAMRDQRACMIQNVVSIINELSFLIDILQLSMCSNIS